MAFQSFQFLVFFPLVLAVYFGLPQRFRKIFLLAASYFFYMCFKPEYAVILAAATSIDYYLGRRIGASPAPSKTRFRWLVLGLVHNIGMLAALKYLDFFNESIAALLKPVNIIYDVKAIQWAVPVGISYYTFKKISYLIDVYRETLPPEKRIVDFALYVSFFPAVMSGPIDRAGKLIPQFGGNTGFDYQRVTAGLKLIAWGLFKKLVIADRLAMFVNRVYDHPTQFEGASLAAATLYFSIQIYCDFSGYTDIALGLGKLLGLELTENFDRPYFARSIGEFWKRWHISLSSWLMDYLFLPIAYSVSRKIKNPKLLKVKAETWAYITGIMITFLLCGLWHGARWTYVIWGTIHGVYLAVSFATKKMRRKLNKKLHFKRNAVVPDILRSLMTFGMVTFAWIFFRADSLGDAGYIVTHLFSGWSGTLSLSGLINAVHFGLLKKELAVAAVSVFFLLLVHLLRKQDTFEQWLAKQALQVRWAFYLVLILWILTFGESGAGNFIYFKF